MSGIPTISTHGVRVLSNCDGVPMIWFKPLSTADRFAIYQLWRITWTIDRTRCAYQFPDSHLPPTERRMEWPGKPLPGQWTRVYDVIGAL